MSAQNAGHGSRGMERRRLGWLAVAVAALTVLTGCQPSAPKPGPSSSATASAGPGTSAPGTTSAPVGTGTAATGKVGHVFIINLENKGYDKTWGNESQAPYLSQTLRSKGVLLTQYYGIAHNSRPNYLAQISGQGSNTDDPGRLPHLRRFRSTRHRRRGPAAGHRLRLPGLGADRRRPAQLRREDLEGLHGGHGHALPAPGAWRRRRPPACARPGTSTPPGTTRSSTSNHHLLARTARPTTCNFNQLASDLESVPTTPNLSYITPNLCNDGHDSPCADGRPGGLVSADAWLKQQVPVILASPAFKQDGILVITFDEAEGNATGPPPACPAAPRAEGSAPW